MSPARPEPAAEDNLRGCPTTRTKVNQAEEMTFGASPRSESRRHAARASGRDRSSRGLVPAGRGSPHWNAAVVVPPPRLTPQSSRSLRLVP
jgi:hypothetical protein